MKKLHFLTLFFIALFLLSTSVYSQVPKLVGKWEVKTTNSAKFGDVEFTNSGTKGNFYPIKGVSSAISNINLAKGMFSFNVFQKNLKFESLTFSSSNELKGVMIDGNAVGTTRRFAVVLTKQK